MEILITDEPLSAEEQELNEKKSRLIKAITSKLRFMAAQAKKPFDESVVFSLMFMDLKDLEHVAKLACV